MTNSELQDLADWIQTDKSEVAARIRELLAPTAQALAELMRVGIRLGNCFDHRHIMRRKIRRYARAIHDQSTV